METRFVPEQGFDLELLDVLPLRGAGAKGAVRGAMRAAALLPESRALLRRSAARAVFSVGGYAAGPVSLAARTLGLPVALLEPNSVIGLANLLIAPWVQRAYTAFELAERHFSPSVVLPAGVPLRPGFVPTILRPQTGPMKILVLGGSQGAKSLNELVPRALSKLNAPLSVVHQCGQAHLSSVRSLYSELSAQWVTVTPFIEDMPGALADADLVVGRSGASAVSEIAAVGRASLLIPYPYASGDHQRINALSLQKHGAAVCVPHQEATLERLSEELSNLSQNRAQLGRMADAARRLGRPQAAQTIAQDFLRLAGIEWSEGRESSPSSDLERSVESVARSERRSKRDAGPLRLSSQPEVA
jgi:UDP-N-acetylglucosamine--N-acetylmuramyl-(pentapeptide) pyrophosphoryl-undecaprenol N-acetylglucosamine transferase